MRPFDPDHPDTIATTTTGCPDWGRLVAEREASGQDPEGWREALDHCDGCPDCRRRALAADPLLLFRRLPAPEVDAAEIDSMRAAVHSLRRASRVDRAARDRRDPVLEPWEAERPRSLAAFRERLAALAGGRDLGPPARLAAALVLAALLALMVPGVEAPVGDRDAESPRLATDTGSPEIEGERGDERSSGIAARRALAASLASLQAVEDLDRPEANVYHLDGDDYEMVLIVDAGLDV